MWVADKRVWSDVIRLDFGYIDLTIHWYEHIPGISGSDLDHRLCSDNTPQFHIYTHILHGNISMTQIYGTAERHTSAQNKIPPPQDLLHGNELPWKLDDRKEFYNKISREVVF